MSRRKRLPKTMPSVWQTCHLAGKTEAEKEEFATVSPNGDRVFRITNQMDHTNQDVVGENCVCNDAGELALTDEGKMKAWDGHFDSLLWSAKHSARWNATRLLAHVASWLIWWKLMVKKELGRQDSWRRLFYYWWDPSRLGGALHA